MAETPRRWIDGADEVSGPWLPARTLTFLLTDVEGSSRLWEEDPVVASAALVRRQEIIADATWRHGGTLPVEQGEGDSSVSVFARASDAGACAVEIQQRLADEPWPGGVTIRVRIAIHTGEAELRPDGTYQGAALNRCARLRAIGHGGQILVSQAAYEVLVDGLAGDIVLRDLGVHRLRDLARPEHVWQLSHPAVDCAFAPLRSLDAVANNLPVQLTSFVGREAEIEAVSALLGESRLVTLTGAGGCGKTRLALAVAAGAAGKHPDGICWVDLAPLTDPALVPAAVAAVLGVPESPVEPITATLVSYLSSRRVLVGLDNCEHLIEACATLAARLIDRCPDVTLLATSRELLGIAGEVTWAVPPLSLPGADDAPTASEAMELFVDRARSSRPNFELGDHNLSAVAEICTRLDGIPLAIELAAARTRMMTPAQIAEGLSDRFHLLTGGGRSALARQRTLENSVDWSHDLLGTRERAVFRRLAVFAGSFDLDAAEAVCAGEDIGAEQVLDLLGTLVDRSLVQVVDDAGAQTRYRLLETVRDYARHKLADGGEAVAARDRHLDHYVAFAERASTGLEGPALVTWLERIDAELDNVRAALDWSAHSVAPERGVHIVGLLTLYWFARSDLGIGRTRLEATVEGAECAAADRAEALSALCMVCYRAGDMARAAAHGDQAIAIGRSAGDRALGRALHGRAWVRCWGENDAQASWSDFAEAAGLLSAADDPVFTALNLALYAWSLVDTSEASRARPLLDEALAISAGFPHARCYALVVSGYLSTGDGELASGSARLEDALALAGEIGDYYAEVFALGFLGYSYLFRGEYEEARVLCDRGLAAALDNRSPIPEGLMRIVLGQLAWVQGDLAAAAVELETSFQLFAPLWSGAAAMVRAAQARVAVTDGRTADARALSKAALELAREGDTVNALIWAIDAQATLARLDDDPHGAEDLLHRACALARRAGRRAFVWELLEGLAASIADQGRAEEAVRLLAVAESERRAAGAPRFPISEPVHAECLARVREALGTGFDDAWAAGETLTLDEALDYAGRGRGERKRPSHGWDSLTPTERKVIELVVAGLTNPQIGERLFVSKRTVQTHLAHVFAKLGVATRAELAAKAAARLPDR